MVRLDWQSTFGAIFELVLLTGAMFYLTLVLISYLEDNSPAWPRFDARDPLRFCEHLAVWLGVKLVALTVRVAAPIFAMLSEASAELGEWFLSRRHPETH